MRKLKLIAGGGGGCVVGRAVCIEALEARTLLSAAMIATPDLTVLGPFASASSIQGYTPSQIRLAYGFDQVSLSGGVAGSGAGQTIAIVDAYNDPNISSDLATFDAQFGIAAPPQFTVVNQNGSTSNLPQTDAGWAQEISLDVEWAHAIAPQANILLVEANSATLDDLLTAISTASSAFGVTAVSMSWGGSEFSNEASDNIDFLTPTWHKGVTFVAASGDEGGWSGPDWPSVSPNVLAVGGTTLNLANSSGAYGSESGWDDSSGGISLYQTEPGYQLAAQNSGMRTTPDVAYDANPNTGFAVYDSLPLQGESGWMEFGGTSAGAPQWAALVAIANQGRKLAGEAVLSGTRATASILYGLYNSPSTYASAFNDITVTYGRSYWATTPGYDGVTGLGSPQAADIISALISGAGNPGGTDSSANGRGPGTARPEYDHPVAAAGQWEAPANATWTGFDQSGQLQDCLAPDDFRL